MKSDSAEGLVIRAMDMYLEYCRRWAADGTHFSAEESVRLWGMLQNAGWLACDAVELIFRASSSSASKKGQRIERYFRDAPLMIIGEGTNEILRVVIARQLLRRPEYQI